MFIYWKIYAEKYKYSFSYGKYVHTCGSRGDVLIRWVYQYAYYITKRKQFKVKYVTEINLVSVYFCITYLYIF